MRQDTSLKRLAQQGKARLGKARQGAARLGWARLGKARRSAPFLFFIVRDASRTYPPFYDSRRWNNPIGKHFNLSKAGSHVGRWDSPECAGSPPGGFEYPLCNASA